MNAWLMTYLPLLCAALISCGFAASQYVVMRAGVFSVATAGYGLLGAYTAALLTMRWGVPPALALVASTLVGTLCGAILSIPLARLRGVFQAIATLAFVQILESLALFSDHLTGGAMGLNGIPKVVDWGFLLVYLAALVYFLVALGGSSVGRVFDTAREDETVAVSLGMSVVRHHALAFAISGGIGGLTGGLYAFYFHSITPDQFGFPLLVTTLAAVVLGGRVSVAGPFVGALIMTVLPELARPLAEQRYLFDGALLMFTIVYLPEGIVDTLRYKLRRRSLRRTTQNLAGGRHATSSR